MTRGFVILAQNTDTIDYVNCAEALAMSIIKVMPDAKVSLISNNETSCTVFDNVIPLPYGDLDPDSKWKLSNDWQVYEASPYEETIKIEADMFIPNSIEHWWDVLSALDVVVCSRIRNHQSEISDCRTYRKLIDDNNLPDVYNAITYFKKSETAEQFFKIVRDVFENWREYKALLMCKTNEEVTTDWAYALASHLIGVEKTTMPLFDEMSMVHLKKDILRIHTDDWTDSLIYECSPESIKINTFVQLYPLHYHTKSFANKIKQGVLQWKNT